VITDVPRSADFQSSGIELLNLAWGLVFELYYYLDMSSTDGWVPEPEMETQFWQSGRRTVSTALVLTHQGSDALLQARIAAVSPYLLLSGGAREWPARCEKEDITFSAFRTHDSQDLPRLHDAVVKGRLPSEYRAFLHELREVRNKAVHTVDRDVGVDPRAVLRYILLITESMLPGRRWIQMRRKYLEDYPLSVLHSSDHVDEWQLPFEVTMAARLLGAAEVERFLGFAKGQRRYIVPNVATTLLGSRAS
jgi:hypothetical protein